MRQIILVVAGVLALEGFTFAMPDIRLQSITFAAESNSKILKKLVVLGLDCCDSTNISKCKEILKPESEKDGLLFQTILVQSSYQREMLPIKFEDKGNEVKVKMLLDGEDGIKNITRSIKYKSPPLWVNSEGKELEIVEVGPRLQLSRSNAFSFEKICSIQELIPEWKKAVSDKKENGLGVQPVRPATTEVTPAITR